MLCILKYALSNSKTDSHSILRAILALAWLVLRFTQTISSVLLDDGHLTAHVTVQCSAALRDTGRTNICT